MGNSAQFYLLVQIVLMFQLVAAQSCKIRGYRYDTCNDYDDFLYTCKPREKHYVECEYITEDTEIDIPQGYYYNNYKTVQFIHSNLTNILNNFFRSAEQKNIEKLYLNNTHIKEIDRRGFNYLNNLYFLNIAENSIIKFFPGTFNRLNNLQHLNLSHNLISSLDENIFSELTSLKTIDLSYNNLTEIDNKIFRSNNNLIGLNITKNSLTKLHNRTFQGLHMLQYLKLSNNAISVIEEELFMDLMSIKEIDLSYNNLLEIPNYAFNNLYNLCNLNVSRNNITTLNISPNNTIFTNCSHTVFDVSYNKLLQLDLSLLVNHNKELKLQNTTIKSNVAFGNLTTDLDLASTMIPIDATSFQKATSLKWLSLDNNNLTYINEDVFEGPVNLIYLSLINNNLSNLPIGLFRTLYNLRRLNLNNNKLIHLEVGLFSNFEYLTELHLEENKLKDLDIKIFFHIHSIQYINFSNNLLQFFNFEDFVKHIQINHSHEILIVLDNNYWSCNWLIQALHFAQMNQVKIQKGNAFKVNNINGIACKNNNTVLNVFTQNSDEEISMLKILTTPGIFPSTTNTQEIVRPTPQQTEILLDTKFEDTTMRILTDISTSEPEASVKSDPLDDKLSTIMDNEKDTLQQIIISLDKITNQLDTNRDNQGLNIFTIILLCIVIFSQIYLMISKKNKSKTVSKENTFQSCTLELIDDSRNDDYKS